METNLEQTDSLLLRGIESQEPSFLGRLRESIADKYRTFRANCIIPDDLTLGQYMDIEIICRLAMTELEKEGHITEDRAADILYMNGLSIMDSPEEQLPEPLKFNLWRVMQENNMGVLFSIIKRAAELIKKKQQSQNQTN